jgi:iron-sulfur cluster assembly accessory protein
MSETKQISMELRPAAEKFIRRMMRCGAGINSGFRLKVRPGGCSGLAVEFDLAAEPGVNEVVWTHSELRIFLDSASCLLLDGATVDFIDSRSLTGFVITTPGGTAHACAPASTLVPVDALVRR